MIDDYGLLERSEDASAGMVDAAYQVKEKQCYLNRYGSPADKEEAGEKQKLFHEAQDILADPKARRKYDCALKGKPDANGREDPQERLLVEVQSMVISAKDEAEYLALHQTISDLDIPAQQKSCMHTILDQLTAVRLEKELAYAVLCYLGGKEDRKKLADAQQAEQHIMLYCQHGFRIGDM